MANTDKDYITLSITKISGDLFFHRNHDQAIAKIIRNVADNPNYYLGGDVIPLIDSEHPAKNLTGCIRYSHAIDPINPRFTKIDEVSLSIQISGAAFEENPFDEIHRILSLAAFYLDAGEDEFQLFDINGNVVGQFISRHAFSPLLSAGGINISDALRLGNLYAENDSNSDASDEYRLIVAHHDFHPNYHEDEGKVWQINVNGEIAPGFENCQVMRESDFRDLTAQEREDISDVINGRRSFESYENLFNDSKASLGNN